MDAALAQAECSRKRQRTSDDTSSLTGATEMATARDEVDMATRDNDYWFEDGNIILVSRGVAFRVYKGLLGEHSAVFGSMFDIGQAPQAASDQAYGCPVIRLDDSPDDIRSLFRLIYPLNRTLRLASRGPTVDIDFIAAIIRLDHKYELKGLYEQAIGYLTKFYTTSFEAWDDGSNALEWRPEPEDAIVAVNLARLTNTPSILPTALYVCVMIGPDVAMGVERADGTREHLSYEDLRLCLKLRDALVAESVLCASKLFVQARPTLPCNAHNACSDLLRRTFDYAVAGKGGRPLASECALASWIDEVDALPAPTAPAMHGPMMGLGGVNAMNAFHGMYHGVVLQRRLCKNCRTQLENCDRELRRQVWRKLPGWVGLTIGNWDARIV